jgi:AcrR family transcriptional regulator
LGTREAIVEACSALIAEEGVAALSLRKVAARVGIQAPSIYQHFDSKEALLGASRAAAMQALGHYLAASPHGRDARARLLATGMGYVAFAREQPRFFTLLFMESGGRRSLEEPPDADSPYVWLLQGVHHFLGAEHPRAEWLAFGIWSLVHGAAVLRQTHLKDFDGPLDEGVHANLDALLDGWAPSSALPKATARRPGRRT